MNITIVNTPRESQQQKKLESSPLDNRVGAWGMVDNAYSDDNTVDVVLDTGVVLSRVPVASKEWVIFGEDAGKSYNTGERDLPPKKARVFVFMPSHLFEDCFVLPFSGFNTISQNMSAPFLTGEKEHIKEAITPGGWYHAIDYATGSHEFVSPDGKTSLRLDYGNKEEPKEDNAELHIKLFDEVEIDHKMGNSCTIKIFDHEIILKKGEVVLKPKETTIEVDGNATIKATGNTVVESPQVQITGGILQVDGAAAANGQGAFCGLPNCLFTGAPHVSNTITGT